MPHHPNHAQDATRNIRAAFLLNIGFTIIEIVGGLFTNSLAILSDALHDLGDSFSLGLSWYLESYARRGGDGRFSYGYRRFSLLAALINTVILILGSLFILSEAIPRLFEPEHSNAQGMVILSLIGIAVNGLAVLRVKTGHTLNEQVIVWHLLEDVLGWVAVLIVSISLLFWDIHILDPLLSILITVYVLYNVIRNLRKTLALFLQAVPDNLDFHQIEYALRSVPGVISTHHTHIWSLDGQHHVLTTHLVVDSQATKDELIRIKRKAIDITQGVDLEHTTIELEFEDEDCSMNMNNHKNRIPAHLSEDNGEDGC